MAKGFKVAFFLFLLFPAQAWSTTYVYPGGTGGGGGGGGWIVIKYNTKVGTAVTNLIQANGGNGGNFGSGKNAGGANGVAGNATPSVAGLIEILNLSTGAFTTSTSGQANL